MEIMSPPYQTTEMSNTKVLFVTGSINPERGGVARVCCNLANGFKKYGITSFSISVATDSDGYFVDSIRFEEPGKLSQKNREQVLSYFEQYQFSFVILENPQDKWMLDAVSVLKGKTVIIGEFHNSPYGYYNNLGNNRLFTGCYSSKWFKKIVFWSKARTFHWYWKRVEKTIDHMVLLCDAYYDELNKLAFFPREKVSAIPNPFLPVECNKDIHKNNWLLFVGRIKGVHKGLHRLLEIWKRLSGGLPSWQLMVVGGGKELPKWKEVADKMGLKNIHFEDFQTPEPYYLGAKVFLMTSLFEGFPMTLVEAMQYGCVPVAYDSFSALGDIVDNGINGLIVSAFDDDKFVDGVLHLVGNEDILKAYSIKAMEKAREFDVDIIVNKWIELFGALSPIG